MSLTTPRDMITDWRWQQTRLVLEPRQQLARTADGRVTAQDLGPPIWRGVEFSTVPMRREEADGAISEFNSLRGALFSFYAYDVAKPRPAAAATDDQYDLTGITVSSISADRTQMALTGLPAGFVMTYGDFISVRTSIGGRELHRVVRAYPGSYNGLGTTPLMEIEPPARAAVAAADVVDLIKPFVEMRLEPGSLDDPYVGPLHRRVSFQAVQVIR